MSNSLIQDFYRQADGARPAAVKEMLPSTFTWWGPRPFTRLVGADAYLETYWEPLRAAISGWHRQTHILMNGVSNGRVDGRMNGQGGDGRFWVGATGYFHGLFDAPWLGFSPTGKSVRIRWSDFFRIEAGLPVECYTLIDMIDFFQQIDADPLPVSLGEIGIYPAPTGYDGVKDDHASETSTSDSMTRIREFLFEGLNAYDKEQLGSMGVAAFFHPNVKWYGPGGIGACLSLSEFENRHQVPWLDAYPDRQVQDIDCLIAQGELVGASGWAGVRSTHQGPYLGVVATGNPIEFNGIDFWLRRGDRFVENWVFVDMLHLFDQFGVDLLAQAHDLAQSNDGRSDFR
jgi:predicted ester cyclase